MCICVMFYLHAFVYSYICMYLWIVLSLCICVLVYLYVFVYLFICILMYVLSLFRVLYECICVLLCMFVFVHFLSVCICLCCYVCIPPVTQITDYCHADLSHTKHCTGMEGVLLVFLLLWNRKLFHCNNSTTKLIQQQQQIIIHQQQQIIILNNKPENCPKKYNNRKHFQQYKNRGSS